MRSPTIVIDAGGLDVVTSRAGQFRYVVDLVQALHRLAPPASFVFLGGSPTPIPELAAVFADGSRPWRYVPFLRPTGRAAMCREQVRLAATLLRQRADLYHGLHTVIPVLAPCPIISTICDLMYELFPEYAEAIRSRTYRLYRWGMRNRLCRAICISQTTADDAARLWQIQRERLDVVYLGSTFLACPAAPTVFSGIAEADRVILSHYNLEPRKNLAALVRSFAQIPRQSNTRLVLYGRTCVSPEREHEFNSLVDKVGIGAAVTRTGFVSDEQLRWLYKRADVFVFPSLYEGFGYPVLEAMAAGACVVARQAASMPEIVGTAGVLVETADPLQMTGAIARLFADPDERTRIRRAAAQRAEEFTVARMATQTWQTYETALA